MFEGSGSDPNGLEKYVSYSVRQKKRIRPLINRIYYLKMFHKVRNFQYSYCMEYFMGQINKVGPVKITRVRAVFIFSFITELLIKSTILARGNA